MMTNGAILSQTHIQRAKNKNSEHVMGTLEDVDKQQLPVCSREVGAFQERCEINWESWNTFLRTLCLLRKKTFLTSRRLLLIVAWIINMTWRGSHNWCLCCPDEQETETAQQQYGIWLTQTSTWSYWWTCCRSSYLNMGMIPSADSQWPCYERQSIKNTKADRGHVLTARD